MSAEHNPDSKLASARISKEDGSHLPCISEQIGLWEVNQNVYRDLLDDYDVAVCLVRCYSVTSRIVRRRTAARIDSELNSSQRTVLPYYAHSAYNFLYSCWQYLRVAIDSWCPPSAPLVAYSVAHNRGCPWQVGYLTSNHANHRVICLVTTENVEVIDLVNKSDHVLLSTEGVPAKEDHLLLAELINEDNLKPTFKVSSSSLVTKSPVRRSSRWFLRYTDPWPQWRHVAYSPLYSSGDDLSRLIAIGYSNGSVEVIDLMAVESEKQNERQISIFISSPVVLSNSDPRTSLCPIVHIAFLDRNHMFVCHFNGHIDFWYLDWQTIRFPARLMTRLYCEQIIPENMHPSPLTAAAYDSDSKTLVLSILSSRPVRPSSLHKSLGLYCFRVETGAPYLELVPTANCPAYPLTAGGVLSKLRYSKGVLVQWLTSAMRHIHQSVPSEMDGVSFLQTHKSKDISVVAVLQCSGTCSVWSLPQLSPLFIVIGCCSTPPVEPVVSRDPSQPFRLTWWRVPCVRDSTSSPDSPVISDDSVQLVMLRQSGELCILHFKNSEVDKLTLDERQVHELNLSPYASFAYADSSASGTLSSSVLLLDQKASTDVLWKSVLYGERSDTKRHIIRAVRLAATTPSELYNHLILKGCYQDAIELASRHHHDVEWVYQQQWLDLSSRPSSLSEFRNLIDSTLALIRHRPVWVLKQCLSFLPSCADSTQFTLTGRIFLNAMRDLLEHGMTRLVDLSNASLQEPLRIRLVRRLFHLDCLSEILSMEIQSNTPADSVSDPLDRHYFIKDLKEMLEVFRQHSILDVALGYAHAGRFLAVKILINRLPITLGRHRLAILSSLCETVNPVLYAGTLLAADFPVANEPNFICQPELESEAVDRLYSSLLPASVSSTELMMDEDGSTDSGVIAYVKQLAWWVISRSRQIEARSGLVSHALSLIEIGEEVCLRLVSHLASPHQLDQCLSQISMLHLEFTQFAKIIYHNPKETRLNPARSSVSIHSKSRPIALARFHFSHYMSLCLEDRIDIMVQIGLRSSKSHMQQLKSDSQVVLTTWCQLLIYILRVGNNQRNYKYTLHLVTYSLSRTAFHHGFEMHTQLLTCLESGTFHNILRNAAPPNWNQLESWIRLSPDSSATHCLVVLDKFLLTSLLETIMHYRPRSQFETPRAGWPANRSERDLQAAYLKEVTQIIALMSRCIVTLKDTYDQQSCSQVADASCLSQRLFVLSQCASAMSELVQLATSLEHQIGDTVRLGVSSVGELVRCSSDSSNFQRLLAHWIAFITSLARKQPVALETHPSGLPTKPIKEYVRHLRDILQKAFAECPAERWLTTGLQYSLLTAGDQQLVDIAKYLQFDSASSTVILNERQLESWCLCLLHALRNYVNTSVPQPSILPGSKSKSTDQLDPNERMARHCISLFRFSCSRGDFNQNISQVFEVEECLLNASAFLSSVASFVPNAGQCFPTVPFRLRSLWTRSENNFKRRRSLFSIALLSILKSFRHSHSSRRKFLELLKSDALYRTGSFFLLDTFTTADCLTQTCYQYLATTNGHLPPVEILDRTLELLIQAANGQHSFAWLTCALWSSHFVEDHKFREYVRHLRDILQKAFAECPAERWLTTGLQYSLLTAGDQQLVDIAKYLQFDSASSTVILNERQLESWCLCLLHALRNYVNTSVPQPSILPGSKSKSTDQLDPNERMARHCISLFRFSCSRGDFNQNISQVFEVEECLLNASAFLSSVASFVPNAGQCFPTVPFRLRPLWTRSENNFKRRRSLFSIALLSILKSFRHSHSSRRKFLELLKSDALYRTGSFFLLDTFTTADCLTQTCYQYLATTNGHLPPVEILDRTLELLIQAANGQHSFAWLTCALWSSHFVEDHKFRLLINRLNATDNWTVLHSLFHIPRPSSTDQSDTGRSAASNNSIVVELFRIWLLRFVTSHCPAHHTVDLYQDLATGWYRLEYVLTTNVLDGRWELPPILQPLLPSFQSLFCDRFSQHCSVNFFRISTRFLRYHDGIPYMYLPVDSCVDNILGPLLATKDLNHTVSLCERSWWLLFLRSWMMSTDAPGLVYQRTPKPLIYGPDVASSDVRLSLCYEVLRSKVLALNPPTNLDPFTCCSSTESTHPAKTTGSKFEQPTFTDRLQLVSKAVSVAASREQTAHLHSNGCFPSGSDLLFVIKEPLPGYLSESLTTQLQALCWNAVYKCLCICAMTALPNIDINRFNEVNSYKLDTIRSLSRTNLSLGLCLALHAQLPLRDALYCRLSSLFLDVPDVSYANLMSLLQTPLPNVSEFGSYTDHPLLPFLLSEPIVNTLSKALSLFAKSATTVGLCSGDLYAMYGLKKCTNSESCAAYRKEYGSLLSLLSRIAPEEDVSSYRRLLGWVKQLMFRTHAKSLKIDQRRWLLTEVIQFLEQRSVGASVHEAENSDRLDTLKHVSMYLAHFDLVVSQLGSVCFPKWSDQSASDNEYQSVDEAELPTGFYAAFLVLDPDEPELTVDLITHLIDVVCLMESDSNVDQLLSTILNKMEWLTHYLPLCLRAMNVSCKDQLNLITKAITLLEIPLPSPFERVLDSWPQAEQIVPTFVTISSHLVTFVRSCVEASQTSSDVPRINHLLGTMLCDPHIRRVYGYQLWGKLKPTENQALFEGEQPCGLSVLQSAVLFLTAQPRAFTKLNAVAVFLRNLSTVSSAEPNVNTVVESLLDACLQSVTDELTKLKPPDQSVISSVSDFIQTVIELIDLLFNDDADCSVRSLSHETYSSGNDAQVKKKLWSQWFNFGLQSGLFLISDGHLTRELLLNQWIKYGCSPPPGLASSGLLYLKNYLHSNKDEHSDGQFSWPLCLLATVYSACLLQPNRDLVLQSLSSLSQQKDPMIESQIDLESCRFFVLSHGDLFTDLVQQASLHCLTLFNRIFTAIDLYLRQSSSLCRCHIFGSHCLQLLREADLWIEATRLACSVHGCPMEHVSLETLVSLITKPKTV
ncbi:hypothetical protein P879_02706 [Paragonimus westermani]|uniref:Neuroblastoma-amplified sequence n=1 Tax=Paragonimus westermani TaxID=34504 RepID=A0A8T0DXF9_9TREM|nr:hypothetical protein P879_02706 [Paragonimus westermani]